MYGLWCLFSLIVLAGLLGGFIFTLSSPGSHKFRMPFSEKDIESGFLGHIVIGVGGAFVALAASVPVFDLQLNIFDQVWSSDNKPENLIPVVLYVLAIGIVGGFSGLRIISGVSDAMLKKLKAEIESNRQYTEEEIRRVRKSVAKNYENDRELREELNEAKVHTLLLEGNFLVFSGKPDEGVEKIKEYLSHHPDNAKALSWLGMGYKRMEDLEKAIEYARKAIELKPDNWVYHYNLACYQALLEHQFDSVRESLQKAFESASDIDDKEEIIESLTTDDDFESIRSLQEFAAFKEALVSSLSVQSN